MLTRFLPKDATVFDLEMAALARLVKDNGSDFFERCEHTTFPVRVLGSGNFGVAFSLDQYPGLVLKVCRDRYDGYPEYIRAVARLGARRKRWMPEVLAHGGDEQDVFWCVLPLYTDPAAANGNWSKEHERWNAAGGGLIEDACSSHSLEPVKHNVMCWDTMALVKRKRKDSGTKAERRFKRQVREFLAPMKDYGAGVYMHPHNALLDGKQWILTDPIASWCMAEKEEYRHAHS
jgi:hypothetical protein